MASPSFALNIAPLATIRLAAMPMTNNDGSWLRPVAIGDSAAERGRCSICELGVSMQPLLAPMRSIIPAKLCAGDVIRVVAPSSSMSIISGEVIQEATRAFERLGLQVTFARRATNLVDDHNSSSLAQDRVDDLHEAFADPSVVAIFTVIGGFAVNQILHLLDYSLIRANPKILCGYSDITALANAIFARCGLVTYIGPHFSTLAMRYGSEYTVEHLRACLFQTEPFEMRASAQWRDDPWYVDQEAVCFRPNDGMRVIRGGGCSGTIVAGNLMVFTFLSGTAFMPIPEDTVLFLESADEYRGDMELRFVDEQLRYLLHNAQLRRSLRGIVFGRFQATSRVTFEALSRIVATNDSIGPSIPIVWGADHGHTMPMFTFPIGGRVRIEAHPTGPISIVIECH